MVAIIIPHSGEYSVPPATVTSFVKSVQPTKLIIVSTSGSGNEKIERVDGITVASCTKEITRNVEMIVPST